MARTPNQKFILLFEAAKRSLLACEILCSRLDAELKALEPEIHGGAELSERAAYPLLSAAAFIDFAHRFGSLVDSFPLIDKRKPQMKQLRQALAPVESARNHLQHLRGDLSANDDIDYAVLGTLSWVSDQMCFMVSFNQPTSTTMTSLIFDTVQQRWTATRQYYVKDATIVIDHVMEEMRSFYAWLTKVVKFASPGFEELKWGLANAVVFRFEVTLPGEAP